MTGVPLPVLARLTVLAALALGASGCSGEEPLLDDGTQAVPLAGLGPDIEAAGVTVIEEASPVAATTDEVVAALVDLEVVTPEAVTGDESSEVLALDPDATAGLVGHVVDGPGTTVVLVFSGPPAAAVFAASDPEVFADDALEPDRAAYLTGNLVGYAGFAGPQDGTVARLRSALSALARPFEAPDADPSGESP